MLLEGVGFFVLFFWHSQINCYAGAVGPPSLSGLEMRVGVLQSSGSYSTLKTVTSFHHASDSRGEWAWDLRELFLQQ